MTKPGKLYNKVMKNCIIQNINNYYAALTFAENGSYEVTWTPHQYQAHVFHSKKLAREFTIKHSYHAAVIREVDEDYGNNGG